jgi:hypothetical protein
MLRMKSKTTYVLLLPLLLTFNARSVRADMSTLFGLSPRGIGMANAVSAVIDDYAAVYYNPAGLALSRESGFTLGYFYAQPRVKVSLEHGSPDEGFRSPLQAGVFGYRQNLSFQKWKRSFVVGMALAYPDNLKTGTLVRTHLYDEMQFPVFGRAYQMLVMSGGFGIELHKRVYAGAGMRYAVTYSAQDITLVMKLLEGEVLFKHVDVNADTEIQPVVGIILKPWDRLHIAAVWRSGGAPVRIVGKGSGGAQLGNFVLPISLDLNFQDFYTPDEVAGSVAYRPTDKFLVAFEITYARWSKYDVPFGERPPGDPFSDIVIPRVGIEYCVSRYVKLQAGYYYQPSPVEASQPYTLYLDADQHVFSGATELSWPLTRILEYPLRFHLYFQFQYLPHRSLDTAMGTTSIWGYITNIGATVQLRF